MAIPLVDVRAQYAPLQAELERRIAEVLQSGRFILGPQVQAFEEEAAAYLGVPQTIGVANGTDALVLVLDALGIGAGDEVICPAFTFFATAEAIARRGATPVFADIDAATLNLDPADVADRCGPHTKAILAVHIFGRPTPLDELPKGIPVVEDAAQAFGATLGRDRVGSLGIAGTFSFFPSKNLFGLGDGGLIATSDAGVGEHVRLLRSHGSRDKKTFEAIGYNSRLDEIQAAALRLFLERLDEWNAGRREAAARYADIGLAEVCELPAAEPGHVYHVYAVRTPERERVLQALQSSKIGCAAYYSTPLHLQPAFRSLGYEEGSLPETERAGREILALPLWPSITLDQQQEVVETIRAAVTLRKAS